MTNIPLNKEISTQTDSVGKDSVTFFGFWVYIMTDFVLFAGLFATYAVLRGTAFGGAVGAAIFSPPYVLIETLVLLTSSFTMGLSLLAARAGKKAHTLFFLLLTFLLGATFVSMELAEFTHLALVGNSWQANGFFSAYFTLVGTHGLHVVIGLLWIFALMLSILARGFTRTNMRKLVLFSLFWHFLDIIWIFIFTLVYLLGII
jgi:cytochrome o ubiquinol oxidase subunit 3